MNKHKIRLIARTLTIICAINFSSTIVSSESQSLKEKFLQFDKSLRSMYEGMQDTFLGSTFIRYGSVFGTTAVSLLMMQLFTGLTQRL